jgi:hypothetical protein
LDKKKKFLAPDEFRTPDRPAHKLLIILNVKPCNIRDGNMFMNVENVRIGKNKVAA